MAPAPNDLATLSTLDNQILVEALRDRYENDQIYTYVGDILVAVNPFKPLDIYEEKNQQRYRRTPRSEVPPHVYAVAGSAYNGILTGTQGQCCIVSGESGAGKTESAKYVIKQIIYLCQGGASDLERKIVQANPILEAFGNACTLMNDNSSRFGKYSELLFNPSGEVLGAKISEYLLETSRVVSQQQGEQNFHVFYYLFSSPDQSKLKLGSPEHFAYLSQNTGEILDIDTEEAYEELSLGLKDVGFTSDEETMIFTILAGILHLGNVKFTAVGTDEVKLARETRPSLSHVATLLEVDVGDLENVLTYSETLTRGEKIRRNYREDQAYDVRDAMAKALYGRLFGWIVTVINALLAPPKNQEKTTRDIGILDIFGFENLQVNSFEQMCINVANEELQHFFNQHVFQLEQEEYRKEGISVANVEYVDNQALLNMFIAPGGMYSLLDEECLFPKATDLTYVQKCRDKFASTPLYLAEASNERTTFGITHFAGKVNYEARGFLEKNRDTLAPDIVGLLQESGLNTVCEMFLGTVTKTGRIEPMRFDGKDGLQTRGRKAAEAKSQNQANKKHPTAGNQFKNSLKVLVERMTSCRPQFIRCIKPNTTKSPWQYDSDIVMIQLNYTGMLETVRIRREGHSYRPTFEDFVTRYRLIAFKPGPSVAGTADNCKVIIEKAGISDWLIGKTRVFLKYYHADELNERLNEFNDNAAILQKVVRGFLAKASYKTLLANAEALKSEAGQFLTMISTKSDEKFKQIAKLRSADVTRKQEERLQQAREEAERRMAAKHAEEAAKRKAEEEAVAKRLQDQITALQTSLAQKENELTTTQREIMDEKNTVTDLNGKMEGKVTEIAELNKQITHLNEELSKTKKELQVAKEDLAKTESRAVEAEALVAATKEQVQSTMSSEEQLSASVREKDVLLEQRTNEVAALRQQLSEVQSASEESLQQSQRLQSDLQATIKESQDAQKSAEATIANLEEKLKLEVETTQRKFQDEIERKNKEISDLRDELEKQQGIQEELEKIMTEASVNTLTDTLVAEEQVTELKQKVGESEQAVAEFQKENESLKSHIEELQKSADEYKAQVTELKANGVRAPPGAGAALVAAASNQQPIQRSQSQHNIQLMRAQEVHQGLRQITRRQRGTKCNATTSVNLSTYLSLCFSGAPMPRGIKVTPMAVKGFLEKRGALNKNWQPRWFVYDLRSQALLYFQGNDENLLKGAIDLPDIQQCVAVSDAKSGMNEFLIVTASRTYHIRAPSLECKKIWLRVMSLSVSGEAAPMNVQHTNQKDAEITRLRQRCATLEQELKKGRPGQPTAQAPKLAAIPAASGQSQPTPIAVGGLDVEGFRTMTAAFRALARRPPPAAPKELQGVDLQAYVKFILQGHALPRGLNMDEFTVRGQLLKLGGFHKTWQHRWFVFNIKTKEFGYYQDMTSGKKKGAIPFLDVIRTIMPDSLDARQHNAFHIVTSKRTYQLQCDSPALQKVWIKLISAVSGFST